MQVINYYLNVNTNKRKRGKGTEKERKNEEFFFETEFSIERFKYTEENISTVSVGGFK
jgi:hypothetical protein